MILVSKMAVNKEMGKLGEELAALYLLRSGYSILHQNWRHKHWEIDLIAVKNGVLHVVEVKSKQTARHGFPEEAVTKSKFRFIQSASEEFLFQNPQWERVQFDVLSIVLNPSPAYFLLEDVYFI